MVPPRRNRSRCNLESWEFLRFAVPPRSRRGPAAVPPRGIAYFRTQKHCQVYVSRSTMFYSSENEILQWPFLPKLAQLWQTAVLLQVQKAPQCPTATGPFSPTGLTCASKVYLEQESPNPWRSSYLHSSNSTLNTSFKILFLCKENSGTRSFADLLHWLDRQRRCLSDSGQERSKSSAAFFTRSLARFCGRCNPKARISAKTTSSKLSFAATSCEYISSLLQVASNRLWLFGSTTSKKYKFTLHKVVSNAKRRSL